MALFSITDITFKRETRGPLAALETSQGLGTNSEILKYPSDLGSADKGHYMIIYINEQINTQYSTGDGVGRPTIERAREAIYAERGSTNIGQGLSSISDAISEGYNQLLASDLGQAARSGDEKISGAASNSFAAATKNAPQSVSNTIQATKNILVATRGAVEDLKSKIQAGSFLRKIRRTKQAIALYMPDTLNFVYNQSYNSNFEVFNTLGKVGTGLAAGASLADAIKGENPISTKTPLNVASFGLEFLQQQGGTLGNLAKIGLAQLGVASNPGLEVIYGSPSFRNFRFDFLFYPRSQTEATSVQKIINTLTLHQAPEFLSQTGGKFLIPPSEFDIEFYYNGQVNKNIPKISTCVLNSIDVDYAPNGFSAYEVPGQLTPSVGGTGMPVAIRLSLNFTETQIVTKEYLKWAESDASNPSTERRTASELATNASLSGWNEYETK